jgi:hypothetical protein
VAEVFAPAHFFLAPDLAADWEYLAAEEGVWEVFQGRLLDPAHSRRRRTFEAWNLYALADGIRAGQPLLALKLDLAAGEVHVVRGLECYVWEGYDAGGNVILSRETRKWVRELIGTVGLESFGDLEELRDELIGLLFHAVVGRRLPLSSVEAPLPGFSFGRLFYCYRAAAGAGDGPLRSAAEVVRHMLTADLSRAEQAQVLETLLRATPADDLPAAGALFAARWSGLGRTGDDLLALLRTVFNEVSLSPWTDFAERILQFLNMLESSGAISDAQAADFLGHLLRLSGRHLTAYDLVTFHHRGANYPDALLLDAVFKDNLARVERRPELFLSASSDAVPVQRRKRLRRRALRQGWLLRRHYEGHKVPDLPTSPGENSRVLSATHPRVPEEQLLNPDRRRRRLYDGDPLPPHAGPSARAALAESYRDLLDPEEYQELGLGLFLDRPFGGGKAPAEPDATPLLASLAFSASIARKRLDALEADLLALDVCGPALVRPPEVAVRGLELDAIGAAVKPATVSLADARLAALDFVFVRTQPGSVRALLEQFDLGPAADFLRGGRLVLLARAPDGPQVIAYDEALRPRFKLEALTADGYVTRAGQERPAGGLRVSPV